MAKMSINFMHDPKEDYSPNGDGYLIPVYFEKELLINFMHDPAYSCTFISETYGSLSWDGGYVSFGINSQGHVILWLGDIKELSDDLKYMFKSKNVDSDHEIASEFKQAQISGEFTESIIEVELFLLLNKINKKSQEKFKFDIFNSNLTSVDEVLKMASNYKKIIFNNVDILEWILNDLNKKFIETINKEDIKKYLDSLKIPMEQGLGEIKNLELFLKYVLLDKSNNIAPFFYLYDLRIWADHISNQSQFRDVVIEMGLDPNSSFDNVYKELINRLNNTLSWILKRLEN